MNDKILPKVIFSQNIIEYTTEDGLCFGPEGASRREQWDRASEWLQEQEELLDNIVVYYDTWEDDELIRSVVLFGQNATKTIDGMEALRKQFGKSFRFNAQYVDDTIDMISLELDF